MVFLRAVIDRHGNVAAGRKKHVRLQIPHELLGFRRRLKELDDTRHRPEKSLAAHAAEIKRNEINFRRGLCDESPFHTGFRSDPGHFPTARQQFPRDGQCRKNVAARSGSRYHKVFGFFTHIKLVRRASESGFPHPRAAKWQWQ